MAKKKATVKVSARARVRARAGAKGKVVPRRAQEAEGQEQTVVQPALPHVPVQTLAYLTPTEAADILRVDMRTMYGWLKKGKMKAVRFGGTWRIPRAVVIPV